MDTDISFKLGYFVGGLAFLLAPGTVLAVLLGVYHLIRGHGVQRAWKGFREMFLVGAAVMLTLHTISTLIPKAESYGSRAPESTRAQFASSIADHCFTRQRSAAGNASVGDREIRIFCNCYANELTLGLTQDDVDAMKRAYRNQNLPETLMPILLKGRSLQKIGEQCADEAYK